MIKPSSSVVEVAEPVALPDDSLRVTVRKTFDVLGGERKLKWVVVAASALLATVLEMLGAVLVFIVLSLVGDPDGGLDLPIIGNIRERFGGVDDSTFLLGAAVVLALFFVIRLAIQIGLTYIKFRVVHDAGARLSSRLAEGYLRLPYAFHLRRSSAELVRNAHPTIEMLVSQSFLPLVHVLTDGLVVLGLLVVLVSVAPVGTALAVPVIGGAALLLLKVVQPRLKRLGRRAQAMRKTTLASIQQSLYGIRDIKILGAESHFGRVYHRDRQRLSRALYLHGTVAEMPRHVIETALVGFILVMFGVSVITGIAAEELFSTLGIFGYAGFRILPALHKIVKGLNNIRFTGPALDQVHGDVKLIERLEIGSDDVPDLPFEEEIRLDTVSFVYDGVERPAVSDVDLVIRRGEVVGICGQTGGGKTTLTDLITGILQPTSGRVTADGVDIHDRLPAWFRKLGVVPQMVFVIDDTLRRNIALGVKDDDIDEEAVREAVHLAQLEEFVDTLPDGLDTVVGERGVRISGGERQRTAIARALYRHPEVLIFDEGTSALDNTTEAVLMSSLERLRGRHTILLVAHRLSTVRNCDEIVYLDGGRIRGIGSFEELQETNQQFRALVQSGL